MDLGFVIGIWTTTLRFCIPSTGPQDSGHLGLRHFARYYTNSSPQGLSASKSRNARAGYSWGPPSGRQPEPPGASQRTRESAIYRTQFKPFNAYHTEEPWLGAGLHLFWSRTHTLTSTTTNNLFNDLLSAWQRLGQFVGKQAYDMTAGIS